MASDISLPSMALLDRFIVLLHSRTSDINDVNEAKKYLFTQKSRTLENILPTKAALEQHIKRASYQANCWNKALHLNPELPNPAEWHWQKDTNGWEPLWTTLQETSKSCYELIHCGCKKDVLAGAGVARLHLSALTCALLQEIVRLLS